MSRVVRQSDSEDVGVRFHVRIGLRRGALGCARCIGVSRGVPRCASVKIIHKN